jgi:hypothetical protein
MRKGKRHPQAAELTGKIPFVSPRVVDCPAAWPASSLPPCAPPVPSPASSQTAEGDRRGSPGRQQGRRAGGMVRLLSPPCAAVPLPLSPSCGAGIPGSAWNCLEGATARGHTQEHAAPLLSELFPRAWAVVRAALPVAVCPPSPFRRLQLGLRTDALPLLSSSLPSLPFPSVSVPGLWPPPDLLSAAGSGWFEGGWVGCRAARKTGA